jgi:hypothetical protein
VTRNDDDNNNNNNNNSNNLIMCLRSAKQGQLQRSTKTSVLDKE